MVGAVLGGHVGSLTKKYLKIRDGIGRSNETPTRVWVVAVKGPRKRGSKGGKRFSWEWDSSGLKKDNVAAVSAKASTIRELANG